jgi:diadenosine tetraphosphate (Ap4A) HIT family hydrolase
MLPSQGRGRGFEPRLPLMDNCDVCAVLKKDVAVIFDSRHWRVALDCGDQYYLGRSFITSKRHVGSLTKLSTEEWQALQSIMKSFEAAVISAFGASLINWTCLMNNAFRNEPFNPHVHWHVRPRYATPVTIDNETFTDPEFGEHYARQTNRIVSSELSNTIILRIQANWPK